MKISASFLQIQNDKEKIEELNDLSDYMHYDIMDGYFTCNQTLDFETLKQNTINITKPKDVHLMVKDIYNYIDMYSTLNPEFITFHYEINDTDKIIDYIKEKNIKVGISINPDTDVTKLIPYLEKIDLVLVMSVIPGKGGQTFIDISDKINYLDSYRKENNLNYLIEVDGGINKDTINKISKSDIIVVGSYITSSDDYNNKIEELRNYIESM